MIEKYRESVIPQPGVEDELTMALRETAGRAVESFASRMEALELSNALANLWQLVRQANRYIEDNAPWDLFKNGADDRLNTVLYSLAEVLRIIAIPLSSVMVHAPTRIREQLGLTGEARWNETNWGGLKPGTRIARGEALFPRIETPKRNQQASSPGSENQISIEEFGKLELRTVRVLAAEPVPKSDRLLKLQVDLGEEKRQVVAGIAQHYAPADLIGKTAVLVANLKPAKIRGVESQGMLLAAVSDDKIAILTPDSDVGPGCKVR
jgi:methionyl-tRNA synthetase